VQVTDLMRNGPRPVKISVTRGAHYFAVGDDRRVFQIDLGTDKPPTNFVTATELTFAWDSAHLHVFGPWLDVRQSTAYSRLEYYKHWIYRTDDPNYALYRPIDGQIVGDRLYEPNSDGWLTILDLPTRKELGKYVVPGADPKRTTRIVGWAEQGERVALVSSRNIEDKTLDRLRVDLYERGTGTHLGAQVLNDAMYYRFQRGSHDHHWRETQVLWQHGRLLVADTEALHAFAPAPPGAATMPAPAPPPPEVATWSGITVDGQLDDWGDALELASKGGAGAASAVQVFVTHDNANLYVAVVCPRDAPRPRFGRGPYGGGDWLDLAVHAQRGSVRWAIGPDVQGRTVWEVLEAHRELRELPNAIAAQARHDAARGRLIYEVAVPLSRLANLREREGRNVGLTIVPRQDRTNLDDARPDLAVWARGATGWQRIDVGALGLHLQP
jgi:hypothetical protein